MEPRGPRTRAAALIGVLALLLLACGQLPNVHRDSFAGAPGGENAAGIVTDPGAGDQGVAGVPAPGGGSAAGGAPGGTTGGGTSGSGSGGGRATVQGTDRTGVTEDTIVLGAHAPVTGAAPLPARSFEQAADLYWRWITEAKKQTVLGRSKVELVFEDDRYQPSSATQVCRELERKAFALAGAGGTDQIQACARFANSAGVPYNSAGVTERGVAGLPWYFAFSMTYRAQGLLLAQYVKANFGRQKVAAVFTDTPNFDDAVQGWEQGVKRSGLNYFRTFRHPKGDNSWYNTVARDMQNAGVKIVYLLSSPVDYIRFAQQGDQQGFRPRFVGVGISMGLNPVLRSGCPEVDGGIFFSPFPGLDWARRNVPEFFQAAERFGTPRDDLAFAIWAQSATVHETFKRYGATYGNDLTREDYRAMLERQQDMSGGIFPELNYSPQNHFGAGQVHVLKADCAKGEHVTLDTFRSSF